MKIVLVGHVCIDINHSEHSSYTNWGSSLMYMGHYIDKYFNEKPLLIASSGHDFKKYAKQVRLVPSPQEQHTFVIKNYTHNHRRVQQCEYIDYAKPVPITKDIQEHIAEADIICVATLLPNYSVEYVSQLLSFQKKKSLKVLLPQGNFRAIDSEGHVSQTTFKDAEAMISLFDLIIFSEDDHPEAMQSAKRWGQKAQDSHIIVTEGSHGASWIDSGGNAHNVSTDPVPETEIVDSVGCGDIFTAATMRDYYYNRNLVTAIKAGNKAARAKLFTVGI